MTGIRQDGFAKAHPLVVEEKKDARLFTSIPSCTARQKRSRSSGRAIRKSWGR